ncbi:MAG: lipid-A-disaccharide synthase [Bacteroidetes bacterium 4572_128]|nr:MAG: lipid-A-disaccharide synthase [Bacteroidetes bacterium 4572_128]
MKYYIIVGEASGDLHASNLMKSLKKIDKNPKFRYFGGDKMKEQGGKLVKHYKKMSFMGIWEVILNLKTIFNNLKFCKKDIKNYQADAVILVDYAGFNLKIAKFINLKTKVFYYISPKIWAWNQSRAKIIKKYVNKMFVIFPFEIDFYKKYNYKVDFVGNPIIDEIEKFKKNSQISKKKFLEENNLENKKIISILAGSRKQEIEKNLPIMLEVIPFYKDFQFVIAAAPSIEKKFYKKFIENKDVKIFFNKTYQILQFSYASLVTSGTATLETALFSVPQIACYKTSFLTYIIGKSIVKIPYFSLVNIVMNEEIIRELLQKNMKKEILKIELDKILFSKKRDEILKNYKILKEKIGETGASDRTAKIIFENLKKC